MAKSGAVWGIDIGQCALKALRCRAHEKDDHRIVVEAFDYVEYPQILSQPDADREALIAEALETFLSRNELQGDRVAISVPGQNGLARFIKLPPVEAKKIPDIVKYEARQQIPFALEDVVWDYQALQGGSQEEGYALETEVGLFAMKRDQASRALRPLEQAGIDVDFIQLAPLAVYNFVAFDRLKNLEGSEPFDPSKPPPSIMVLSFGADTTDLVITNGFRVWQRNIPIGGGHFTKALSKELKLTFAKAEHLKRNATKAEDPKAIFQAMRPVFSDLVSEVQRSIGFFKSNNKKAEIKEIIGLGNVMRLPGLQRYLSQNLDQEVVPVEEYQGLIAGSAAAAPAFKENYLTFAPAYGLCVQALGMSLLKTNLVPEEIVTARLVRAKKPWVLAAASVVLLGMLANYYSYFSAWQSVDVAGEWKAPIDSAKSLQTTAAGYASESSSLKDRFAAIQKTGENLQSNADGRLLWLEMIKAINAALPQDKRPAAERKMAPDDITNREELQITAMECQYFPELSGWYAGPVQQYYEDAAKSDEYLAAKEAEKAAAAKSAENAEEGGADAEAPAEGVAAEDAGSPDAGGLDAGGADAGGFGDEATAGDEFGDPAAEGGAVAGPTGPGWVIELTGHHFHNSSTSDDPKIKVDRSDEGEQFIRRTFIKQLLEGTVSLPDGEQGEFVDVKITDLGISYPVVVTKLPIRDVMYDPEATSSEDAGRPAAGGFEGGGFDGGAAGGFRREGAAPEAPERKLWKLRQYDFKIQFVWQPTPRHKRLSGGDAPEGDLLEGTADAGGAPGFN